MNTERKLDMEGDLQAAVNPTIEIRWANNLGDEVIADTFKRINEMVSQGYEVVGGGGDQEKSWVYLKRPRQTQPPPPGQNASDWGIREKK